MVSIASIRMSKLRIRAALTGADTADLVSELLWQHVEACISVVAVSFVAFRAAFAAEQSQRKIKKWYSPGVLWKRRVSPSQDERIFDGLPSIPSATLTGMRTFIQKGSDTSKTNHDNVIEESLGLDSPLSSHHQSYDGDIC